MATTRTGTDLFGEAMLADPYAAYARLRATDPVHWSAALDSWVLTRFDDVRDVLRNPAFSSTFPQGESSPDDTTGAPAEILARTYTFVRSSLVFSDPPAHTRLRRLVNRAFTPGVVEDLTETISATTDRLMRDADDDDAHAEVDLVAGLAEPLPLEALGALLGLPLSHADQRRIKVACDDFLLPFGRDLATLDEAELARAQAAGRELDAFVDTVLDRPSGRDDDVVGRLLAGEADDRLTRAELFANIVLLLVAGHENLTSLLGNGLVILLDRPDVRRDLADDPSQWPAVVDELLRLVTPNQFIRRQALGDATIGDRALHAGDAVLLVLAGANRDPAQYPDPDTLQLDRPDRRDLSMGLGIHYCLGAPFARLQARIAMRTLLERYPDVRRTDTPLSWVPNFNVRLLRSLPVTLH